MADVELIIKIPETTYTTIKDFPVTYSDQLIAGGQLLPKGHGDLIDKNEILSFLKCPEYENCDWRNCYECNKSLCINLNNVNRLVPIIKEQSEE